VRKRGTLNVYLGQLVGHWPAVVKEAIRDFNTLSKHHNLGVTLVETKVKPTDQGGADVQIETGSGTVTCTYRGQKTRTPSLPRVYTRGP
jgi:hypothetical protein